ncbi:glycosyltransferase family 2 protein [Methanothrix sp.]|jgi:GT2 family glycosyltransferase
MRTSLYLEDVDLAMRLRLAGWKCLYVPRAEVVHHHGKTAGVVKDLAVYYDNRNIVWYPIYPVKDFSVMLYITVVNLQSAVIYITYSYMLHGV